MCLPTPRGKVTSSGDNSLRPHHGRLTWASKTAAGHTCLIYGLCSLWMPGPQGDWFSSLQQPGQTGPKSDKNGTPHPGSLPWQLLSAPSVSVVPLATAQVIFCREPRRRAHCGAQPGHTYPC